MPPLDLTCLVRGSAFDLKSVFRRYSRPARREERLSHSKTLHEPNWLNWVRLMRSTAFDLRLTAENKRTKSSKKVT